MIVVDIAFATADVDPPEQVTAWRDLVNLQLAITQLPGAGWPREFSGSVADGDWDGLRSRRGTKITRRRNWGPEVELVAGAGDADVAGGGVHPQGGAA